MQRSAFKAVAIAGVVIFALFLTGCHATTRSDLVGRWVYDGGAGKRSTLVLESDGRCSVDRVPPQVVALYGQPGFGDPLSWADAEALSGTWHLDSDGRIAMSLSDGPAEWWYPDQRNGQATIEAILGDPDNGQWFVWVEDR